MINLLKHYMPIVAAIKKMLLSHWRIIAVIIVAVGFFIAVSGYIYFNNNVFNQQAGSQGRDFVKWSSPDETANYIFSKLYGQTGSLEVFEKYNLESNDIMRPRSFRSDQGWIKPVSFLGMALIYGQIVKLAGYQILPYLTALFAAVAIIFYYLLIRNIFGRGQAWWAALLLASFPVYLHYSAHGMFHNVLFTALLIIGLYFLSAVKHKKFSQYQARSAIYSALGGLFIGLAGIVRTSELLWLGPMLVILLFFNIKKISLINFLLVIIFISLPFLPVMYWNQILYGSYWQTGYNEMNQSLANIGQAGSAMVKSAIAAKPASLSQSFLTVKNNLFYFGLHPRLSAMMFYYYFVRMFYWLFWPAALGLVLFFVRIKRWKSQQVSYIVCYFFISLILILYYGSWQFHDNPDASQTTIGNSYTRYWLPIYLGAFPFFSMFLVKLTKVATSKTITITLRSGLVMVAAALSIYYVLYGSSEALMPALGKNKAAAQELNQVLNLTEANAVIITRYHDKLFFPERKVIVGLFDDQAMIEQYANLAKLLPVYYYNFTLPDKAVNYLNSRKLTEAGLRINKISQVNNDFTLYKLTNAVETTPK